MSLRVKVCGLTTAVDAALAAAEGADLLGFVLHPPSPRHCPDLLEAARDVRDRAVLVAVSDDPLWLARTAAAAGLHRIQPHASAAARGRVAEALRREGFELLLPWPDQPGQPACAADLYLWEPGPGVTGLEGGSGVLNPLRYPPPGPYLLAGGLDAGNLAARCAALGPEQRGRLAGVDAASRLESAPGRKDPAKLRAFLQAARALEREGASDAL